MHTIRKRWNVLLGLALMCAVLLAGCGNGNHLTQTNTGSATESTAPDAAATQTNPSKIVVTYFPYADHLFALGKGEDLIGVVNLKSLKDFTVYEPFLADGHVADLGDELDLEKIAALNPDLIIASSADADQIEQLSKIAKTVTVNATLNWQETIRGVADAIGEKTEAEAYIGKFTAKQTEAAAVVEQSGAKGKTALFVMPWQKSFTYWSGPRLALYYEKLGFKPFDGLSNVGDITLEGISELDPEYLFIGKDYTNTSEITLEQLEKDPVWNSLSAVKNKKMFVVDTEILGPLAMGQFKGLAYMEQLFQEKKAE
ncbi:ABC transporter substrate-binding protein [Cohnella sp. GCM10020058]|uniref:ABC transporter substrate-binding protein n=1 Tax=Cohnella sp. GCM10020058 TaxID=3317330 RepID=UPI00362DB91F